MNFQSSDSLLLVGNLKVGKSTIFSWYTGRRRQSVRLAGKGPELIVGPLGVEKFTRIVDAPGFNSLLDRSEDANKVRQLLIEGRVGGICLVLDAKNLRRGISLALELSRFGLPMVAALNMSDEGRQRGLEVNTEALADLLGIPVVATVASEGRGLRQLRRVMSSARPLRIKLNLPADIENAILELENTAPKRVPYTQGLTFTLAAGLPSSQKQLALSANREQRRQVEEILAQLSSGRAEPIDIVIAEASLSQSDSLWARVAQLKAPPRVDWLAKLGKWSRVPLTGIPIAMVVLTAVYLFVGSFGATYLVDLIEGRFFGELVLPIIDGWVENIPWTWVQEMLMGQFGLLRVGLVLSVAIVMPVLATFFFAFA